MESNIECALSGLNGAYYNIHALQFVNFARPEGQFILRFFDSKKNLRRFKVNSGRGYYVINSEKCIDMETNTVLMNYEGNDGIDEEAKSYEVYNKQRAALLDSYVTQK